MKYFKSTLVLALAFILTSCYHAQITTDRNPSNQVIEKPWASSFIFGLVPPPVVETAAECPNGLARVETKISFVNGLVSAITFQLYTPMHITVTCAAAGTASLDGTDTDQVRVNKNATEKEKANAINEASKRSIESGKAVFVAFD